MNTFSIEKYEFIYPNQVNTIAAPLEDAYIEFSENTFTNGARVLVYENEIEDFDISRENTILSNLITIQSNSELNSDAHIHFGLNHIDTDYSMNHIGIGKFDNNEILYMPSYIENNKIISKINSLGTYMMTYNELYNHEDDIIVPLDFNIQSCYPNPFNPTLSINYSLDIRSDIKVRVYNILGQEVSVLHNGYQPEGEFKVTWDASSLSSGVYYVSMVMNGQMETMKAV